MLGAAGALKEFESSGAVSSQAAAALQSRALVYVYSCNLGAAIQVCTLEMHADLFQTCPQPVVML